jgi:hypothetical protein
MAGRPTLDQLVAYVRADVRQRRRLRSRVDALRLPKAAEGAQRKLILAEAVAATLEATIASQSRSNPDDVASPADA